MPGRLRWTLHRLDGLQGVLARAHDHHPAGDFTFAIQLGDTAPHFRPEAQRRHIPEQNRCPCFIGR